MYNCITETVIAKSYRENPGDNEIPLLIHKPNVD